MDRYFSYDPDADEFTRHTTAEKAQNAAKAILDEYRAYAELNGWPEEAGWICWGEVRQVATKCNVRPSLQYGEVYDMKFTDVDSGESRED